MSGVRSIRPFQSSEQYLFAMKEDMAEWLKDLYEMDISVDTFLEVLETGFVLCQHANNITRVAAEFSTEYPGLVGKVHLPRALLRVNRMAQPGTFQARDNVSNFIQWCRKEMDITDVLMFETDDLVLRKNEKNFVLCLLELARRASRFGMSAPVLIQMEEQIEEEIREEMELPPEETPIPKPQRRPYDFKNLDQMVQHLVSRCTCPVQFSMIKVSEGKYRVGDSSTLIFVRILRNHVMVRVGGGWDTLEHYLDKHDPCRCTSLSHKQALKAGGSQKQTAPIHEIRSGLNPKLQTSLIVSRSQSPLPAVDWRTYTPSMPSVRSQPSSSSSLDGGDRTPASWNTPESSDLKRGVTLRLQERPATPSHRKSFPEERIKAKQITSPRTGRDHFSSSTSSLASQLTESEEDYSRASEVISQAQCGRKAARTKVASQNESSVKSNRHAQTLLQPNTSKDSTPLSLRGAKKQSTVQEQSIRASAGRTRSLSPTKHLQPATRQQAKGKEQTLNSQSTSAAVVSCGPMSLPSPSPTKSIISSSKKDPSLKNQLPENSMSITPPTPRIGAKGESQLKNGGSVLFGDTTKSPSHQMLRTRSIGSSIQDHIEDRSLNTKTKRVSRPHLEISGGTGRCDTVWEDESMERNNTNNKDLSDDVEREQAYTPLPINQEEEQQLYRSLEDEILSNIKELKEDSDENNLSENRLCDFTPDCSISSDTAVHDFSALSSVSSLPSTLKIGGEGVLVPRSGVYINTKWHPHVNYDNVILELSKGQKKLNRVDVENWIAKIPQKVEGDFLTESSLPISNGTQGETERLQMEQPYTRRKTATIETKGLKLRRVPSQRTRRVSKEFKRITQSPQATCDDQGISTTSVPQADDLDKYTPVQGTKPRRSLKKPERVPSIYKLKLRPTIRPRRDNRPEKQPSKIPTPKKYRQETTAGSAKDTKKTLPCQASSRQSQDSQRSSLVRNTAQSTEKLGSDDEAWMSDHSNSPQSKTSGSKSEQGRSQPERTEEDEESWV